MNPETVTIPQLYHSLTIPQLWNIFLSLVAVAGALAYGGYEVGQFIKGSELNGKITELKGIVIQQKNHIKSFDKAQEIINEKEAEIEKLKKELSTDRGQSECCKIILAQIDKTNTAIKNETDGIFFNVDDHTEKMSEKVKYHLDKLYADRKVLYEKLGACNK